jgi:hypothetical protein
MRRALSGEFELPDGLPPPGLETYVIVYQQKPGTRCRVPICLPDDETGGPGLPQWSDDDMLAMVPEQYLRP